MKHLRRPLAALFVLLLAPVIGASPTAVAQSGAASLIQATDLLKIRKLGNVTVSPAGRRVAYTVQTITETGEDADRPYAYRTHLYLVDAAGGAPRQLTRSEKSITDPAWHPDGNRLAFVRTVEGTPQIFVLPLRGGEPYQVTHAKYGATDPAFSPDGTKLLYASQLPVKAIYEATGRLPAWPDERPGRTPRDTVGGPSPNPDGPLAEVRAWLGRNARQGNPKILTSLDFQSEHELKPHPRYRHLFVIAADGPGDTPDPVRITDGYYDFRGGAWLSGGRRIIFAGATPETQHPDRVRRSSLYIASVDGSRFTRLLAMDGYALYTPRPAPKGNAVAFLARSLENPGYAQTELGLFHLDSGRPPRLLSTTFDRSVGPPEWSPDGWYLYTVAPSNGGFPLYRFAPYARTPAPADTLATPDSLAPPDTLTARAAADTLAMPDTLAPPPPAATGARRDTVTTLAGPERLTAYTRGVRSFDVSAAGAFYVMTQVRNPYELYASNLGFTRERRLTSHNASWLEGKRLATVEPFTVRRDSFVIDAWLMKPPTFEEERTYPLLLEIHGGPMVMWGPGEATMWHEFQYLAAQGYAIVYANPRGSGGYGKAFKKANYRDWGTGPASDVLAAASAAARKPWVSDEQQVVTGGSYAGYLTAWIVGHTDRFDAAVAQRGVYDLTTFFGEGNAWRLVPWHFGGYPWETAPSRPTALNRSEPRPPLKTPALPAPADTVAADSLSRLPNRAGPPRSPVEMDSLSLSPRQALVRNSPITYVDQIHTPLLIIHASEDLRTGVSQSEMLYRSLKVLGRPVEYVRYPNAGHDLSRTGDPKQRLDRLLRIYEFFERYIDHPSTMSTER